MKGSRGNTQLGTGLHFERGQGRVKVWNGSTLFRAVQWTPFRIAVLHSTLATLFPRCFAVFIYPTSP